VQDIRHNNSLFIHYLYKLLQMHLTMACGL
jgi:hypothetical protein